MRRERGGIANAVAEQHMRNFLGVVAGELAAFGEAADLLQCPGNAFGLACELHGRGIGEEFALDAKSKP